MPLALAFLISEHFVLSVRYNVINGSNLIPVFTAYAEEIRELYANANSVVITGDSRLGITIARANLLTVSGSTARICSPSLRCKCISSGRVKVIVFKFIFTVIVTFAN